MGQTYTIEGKNSLDDGSWLEINVVLAIGNDSEYCINLPTDFRFFRIRRGGELPVVPEFIDPTLSIGVDDICLTWVAVVGRSDTIQGKASLVDLDWVDVDSVVAESVLGRYCVTLPTDLRFFRIQVGDLSLIHI